MKTNNKKKVVVSVLALAMGAGLAGSISGSVAWYQYSTRTTAQLQGVSTGTVRNLRIRIADGNYDPSTGDWKSDLSFDDIKTYLGVGGDGQPAKLTLNPVTIQTSDLANNSALATREYDDDGNPETAAKTVPAFSGHPVYQYDTLPAINEMKAGTGAATTFNYVQIPLEFNLTDDKGTGATRIEREIYVVDAFFNNLATGVHADITPALRAHFSSSTDNSLLAKTNTATDVSGALDLNGIDGEDKYGFDGLDAENTNEGKYINYGNPSAPGTTSALPTSILSQGSYNATETANGLLANDSDAFAFTNKNAKLGKTTTEGDFLKVTLTIWLEGWTKVGATPSSIWDANYIGSDFGLQLRFACQAEQ